MQNKEADAGRLTPIKDGSEVVRKSSQKANAVFWLGGVPGLVWKTSAKHLMFGRMGHVPNRPLARL